MQPHQQRVVDEKTELDEKLGKLAAFFATEIYKSLPEDEQKRLSLQAFHMGEYSKILNERIERFN